MAAFAALAIVFSWPLPAHLATRVLGPVGSDCGVYIWNLWVFNHEVMEDHHLPLFTSAIFSLDWTADLSLHNYTIFADLLAIPLLPLVGIVAAFNLLYLGTIVLNGWAMFVLARALGVRGGEAWLAGALFALAPSLIARSAEHFSLFMAAPLVFFVLVLQRLDRGACPVPTAVAGGATMAWASFCDPYYGVYCLALGVWHWLARQFTVSWARRKGPTGPALRALDIVIGLVALLATWIAVTGGWSGRVLGVRLAMQTLYTPVLLLTVLVAVRVAAALRVDAHARRSAVKATFARVLPFAAFTCALLMSPVLYAVGRRAVEGRYVSTPVFWRTSMPGVDLLSFFVPNPNHPWFRGWSRAWLTEQNGGFVENVASIPLVALAVIGLAVWRAGWKPPRYWAALTLVAAAIALGPFLQVAGIFTYIPTPWALLRYAPLVSSARAPARFVALVVIAVAVMFALALQAAGQRWPRRRRLILATVGCLLLFELLPAPRQLYSAEIPSVYHHVAADPRPVRILEIPFGVRDGLSSYGNYTAATQFYQTFHHKRIVSGYLSRVSAKRVEAMRRRPILRALISLSEGRPLPEGERALLKAMAPRFVQRWQLGYVVVDRSRASDELVRFAVETLDLEKVAASPGRELYRPRAGGQPPALVDARR